MSSKSEESPRNAISLWADRINWPRRVKAICKPCWELKYCPYGPLVEEFPLPDNFSNNACRIFGHECPVFHVAEPLTETKELRNISRSIPRPIQFRVLQRENGVCRICHRPIPVEDIHFDHIIPWSKGGPTEESNIQLLCRDCNLKKRNKYEDEFLVNGNSEHVVEPVGCEILDYLMFITEFRHDFFAHYHHCPDAMELANELNDGEKTKNEEEAAKTLKDLDDFFKSEPPNDLNPSAYSALQLRWGYTDMLLRKLRDAAKESGVTPRDLLTAEIRLVERLGWMIKNSESERKKWLQK